MIIIFITIMALAWVCPKSKFVTAIALLFMFLMYSFVYYEGDLQVYEWIYREYLVSLDDTSFEPGFTALIYLSKVLGLSFTGFRIILALFFCGLLYQGIRKYTDYTAITVALVGVFPFFVFTSVMRSGIAFAILLNGFHYLIEQSCTRKKTIKYVAIVLLAALFHYSSLLMLILLLVKMDLSREIKAIGIFVSFLFYLFLNYSSIIFLFVSSITKREKTLQWFARGEGSANIKGAISIAIILLINLIISICVREYYRNNNNLLNGYEREKILSEVCVKIAFVMLYFFPFMVLATPFLRLVYMILPVLIANGINAAYRIKSGSFDYASVSVIGVMIMMSVAILRFFYDLPYIKAGYIPFQELLFTKYIIY